MVLVAVMYFAYLRSCTNCKMTFVVSYPVKNRSRRNCATRNTKTECFQKTSPKYVCCCPVYVDHRRSCTNGTNFGISFPEKMEKRKTKTLLRYARNEKTGCFENIAEKCDHFYATCSKDSERGLRHGRSLIKYKSAAVCSSCTQP